MYSNCVRITLITRKKPHIFPHITFPFTKILWKSTRNWNLFQLQWQKLLNPSLFLSWPGNSPGQRYRPLTRDYGTLCLELSPPRTGVTPRKGPGISGTIMGWRCGTPLPRVWTETHLWNQYLPHPSDASGKNCELNVCISTEMFVLLCLCICRVFRFVP